MYISSFFFLASCSQKEQDSATIIPNDGHVLELSIPREYLETQPSGRPVRYIWFDFNYPNLSPASSSEPAVDQVPVLLINIANKRTRAEYMLDAEVAQKDRSAFLEHKKRSLEIEKHVTDRSGNTYVMKRIFSRAEDGSVIYYEIVPDLNITVSRRYSDVIELRYVIVPQLFSERDRVDASVISMMKKFSND